MAQDDWVVLAEHQLRVAWNPIDAGSLELLFLEAELNDHGIRVAFLPYRPGESGGFTDALAQPLQLLVKASDLDRAKEIAAKALEQRNLDSES